MGDSLLQSTTQKSFASRENKDKKRLAWAAQQCFSTQSRSSNSTLGRPPKPWRSNLFLIQQKRTSDVQRVTMLEIHRVFHTNNECIEDAVVILFC